jgi:hypothetical protein
VDRGRGAGTEGVNGAAADPLTGLCPELPLMGSNWRSISSPQDEVSEGGGGESGRIEDGLGMTSLEASG